MQSIYNVALFIVLTCILGLSTKLVAASEPRPNFSTAPYTSDSSTLWGGVPEHHWQTIPVALTQDYSCLTMGEMVAMIGGSIVGGATADFVLSNAPFTIVGVIAGAALGSLLYRYGSQ